MKAYKGFDKDLKCRGFQYEVGKTYETDEAKLCEAGFHACEAPLDVFNYYPPSDGRYCEVESDDVSDERGNDSKIVAKKLTVGAEIGIPGLVKAHIEWVKENIDHSLKQMVIPGYASSASVSGKGSVALCVGRGSKAKASKGSASVVCERGEWSGEEYPLLAIKATIVDGETIKEDTWYTLKDGEFVEVADEDEN